MMQANFLESPFPVAQVLDIDPSTPARYVNRELSWLSFNWRVLEEAENLRVPLLERLRFLSISATNLDEFYTVRVAGLRELALAGNVTPSIDGLTPAEQLVLINANARELMHRQQSVFNALNLALSDADIHILTRKGLDKADLEFLDEFFLDQVFPVLSPLAIDPAHPFPFLPNEGFALALQLEKIDGKRSMRALLPVPAQIARFVRLPSETGHRFLPLEELLLLHVGRLFPGFEVKGNCAFKVLRDSDLELEDEAEDLVREFEVALKRRRRGEVVRLKLSDNAPKSLKSMIMSELHVTDDAVVEVDGLIGVSDLGELVLDERPDLLWPPFTPRVPERVQDFDGDMFAAIRQKDMLLHHPYETFDMVVRFLAQAAMDPDVVAIKQTLYRTSGDSPIIEALIEAAEAGKQVLAVIEIRARFDEQANVRWARKLEAAGVHVVYGLMGLKTHAKLSLVVRDEAQGLRLYCHIGTGNYNPKTARFYEDLGILSADTVLTEDLTKLFNQLSGFAPHSTYSRLLVAPRTLRTGLLEKIENEIVNAKAGKPAGIQMKLNSLLDEEFVEALYAASNAGVKVDLVVRGICAIRPGIAGLSENIRVRSILGRFLEHSRIYHFVNGGDDEYWIGSSDLMHRNLDRRVESLVRIERPAHKSSLQELIDLSISDETASWHQEADSWKRVTSDKSGEPLQDLQGIYVKRYRKARP